MVEDVCVHSGKSCQEAVSLCRLSHHHGVQIHRRCTFSAKEPEAQRRRTSEPAHGHLAKRFLGVKFNYVGLKGAGLCCKVWGLGLNTLNSKHASAQGWSIAESRGEWIFLRLCFLAYWVPAWVRCANWSLGLVFRVYGLGCGCRVWGSGFRV